MPPPSPDLRAPFGIPIRLFARASAMSLVVAIVAVLPGSVSRASAASVYLCSGYTACANAGYGHAGYASRSGQMYWRMYAGHNCTNYVAYRMIQRGMSPERPWSSTGMAYNWGYAMADITDDVPAVGAVAWWDRGAGGLSSSGHTAYVEKVISPSEILVSEDSWSGDFSWRRITKDGSSWPTGFIHFVDQKTVEVMTPPKVTGTPQVGQTLRGYQARFTPAADHTLQWLRDGVAIPGATSATYTPGSADTGASLAVRDTASRTGYISTSGVSAPTADVEPGVYARVARPSIAGTAEVGEVLTAVPGQWSPAPGAVAFRWKVDGVWQQDVSGPTFTLTRAMAGKTIGLVEVATGAGYTRNFAGAADVGPVVEGVVEVTAPFTASGVARYGSTLALVPGTWTPSDATVAFSWLRDGAVIPGADASTYALSTDDVGRRVVGRAVVSKPRYRPTTRTASFGLVTTPSILTLRAGGRKRGAVATVRVAAAGFAAKPAGTVTVTLGSKVFTSRVVDGVADFELTGLGTGERTLRFAYSGTDVVEPGRASATVTVKP